MAKKILLADDSVTIQKVIELTFMDQNYEVVSVGSGEEALARLDQVRPDLVIADVHMPGASGYEVSRQVRDRLPDVPVLLLVGTFEPFDEGEFQNSGAHRFLKKPFDSQELLRIVGELESLQPTQEAAAASQAPAAEASPAPDATTPTAEDPFADFGAPSAPPVASPSKDEDPFADFGTPAAPPAAPPAAAPDDGAFRLGSLDGEPPPEATTEAVPAVEEVEGEVKIQEPAFEVEAEPAFELEAAPAAAEPVLEAEPILEAEPVVEAEAAAPAPEAVLEAAPAPAEPAPAAAAAPTTNGAGLSDEDLDRIAQRVAELVGERLVKDVAWEVIPDLAEVIIKDRLRELESQVE